LKLSLSKEYGTPLPFIDHLGIERVPGHEGRALLALEIKPAFRNSWNAAHGGVIMTLLDSAMSLAARLHLQGAPGGIMTIEMNAKFISPGTGCRLAAEGRVIGGGKATLFCEAEVHDETGTLVAKGMGTLKAVKKKEE
jgi:uncharacterized protein (TIGR00369 family)